MWTDQVTKTQYINRLLNILFDKATRRKRGSTERDCLLSDLEYIEQTTLRIMKISNDPKRTYTEFEIEQENLQSFSEAIQRVAGKA